MRKIASLILLFLIVVVIGCTKRVKKPIQNSVVLNVDRHWFFDSYYFLYIPDTSIYVVTLHKQMYEKVYIVGDTLK